MIRRLRALDELIGYRGSVLVFLAFWSGGQSARLAWPDPAALGTSTYVYLASIAPLWVLAVPWAICAILCAVQALTVADWLAFAVTAGVLVAWAVIYLVGGIRGAIPQAYWACIVQVAVAGLVLRLSRWPDPPHREQ
ncbi:hypothetical protein OIE13_05930 [Streptosporangium sp. NBC_01810]|uniref:hypothetical protein n=1 Tax=Streptosporangium sp. NBC_01810 TaxID=2975951 RepID=UPI002DD98209|nr:hypothetical protein [Streptosporangium sp. NBC_01810]WSA27412.1 hypothetical protein OIE13_05930 [Streptosporangium sp. NBC_01810]